MKKVILTIMVLALTCAVAQADILNWQTGLVIPGTESITPGPGADLSHWNTDTHNLKYASLSGLNLSNSGFYYSWLNCAYFRGADLTNAVLLSVTLTDADFTNATIKGAHFSRTTDKGFAKEQLYSTASYTNKDLGGMYLEYDTLSAWDLHSQNLVGASFEGATLIGTNLAGANLTNARFNSQANLTNANLTGANLTGVGFGDATLTGTDFTDAVVKGAKFGNATSSGFTKKQLYSTASYKMKELGSVYLGSGNLFAWDLHGQNMEGAYMGFANLTYANLTGAYLAHAYFYSANLDSTNFSQADLRGADVAESTGVPVTHDTIWIDGTIAGLQLTSGEELVVRNYNMAITVNNSWTMQAGVLKMVLEGNWQSVMNVGDGVTPNLGGMLNLSLADGIDPATLIGTQFKLFNWNGRLLAGDSFDSIVFAPGTTWDTTRLYTDGIVTLTAVPEPMSLGLLALGGVLVWRHRRPKEAGAASAG
jgi:uncharacterized protein YjbI with pentapeptide repeats